MALEPFRRLFSFFLCCSRVAGFPAAAVEIAEG
jgi:hypothetical protein